MIYKKERIKGYEDYQVDTCGVVYGKNGKPLNPSINPKGYCIVNLYSGSKESVKGFAVHQLVARQFIKNNKLGRTQVNHIDGNKINNNIENLEWVSHKENSLHSTRVLGNNIGKKNGNAKRIEAINEKGEVIYQFDSVADAGKFFTKKLQNGSTYRGKQSFICSALKGKKKSAYGLKWRYI